MSVLYTILRSLKSFSFFLFFAGMFQVIIRIKECRIGQQGLRLYVENKEITSFSAVVSNPTYSFYQKEAFRELDN